MALINCPECGREKVSDNAEMCPGCGYGIKAHYARLKEEAEKEERIIELKKQDEERIKNIPKPQKPSYNIAALFIVLTLIALIAETYLFYVSNNGTLLQKDEVEDIFAMLTVCLPILLIVTIVSIYDYVKRLKQYNYILDHFAEYQKEQYQRRVDRERKLEASTLYSSGVRVECPYCHSKNTRKISGASKAGNVALFGVFAAGKVSKQWHCNQCNSDF